MTRGKLAFLLAVIGILLVLGMGLWQGYRRVPSPPETAATPDAQPAAPAPAAVPRPHLSEDFSWGEANEEELRGLVNRTTTADAEWQAGFDETLAEGESFVTEGREIETGVFVFSVIKPVLASAEDGREAYSLSVQRVEVDIAGGEEVLSAPQILVEPGNTGIISTFNGDSVWHVSLRPTKVAGGIRIQGGESIEPASRP